MSKPIEDYGFIGNMNTGALVARDGSIDWLCLPRFDAPACFAALLGDSRHGRWKIAPARGVVASTRRYVDDSLILETRFTTATGEVALLDFMPLTEDEERSDLIRIVRGVRGTVEMRLEISLRFSYGQTVPWVRRRDHGLHAVAGPDAVELITEIPLHGENFHTIGNFTVAAGESHAVALTYHRSYHPARLLSEPEELLALTAEWWREWSRRCHCYDGCAPRWRDAIRRSLVTLKGLTYRPTGGLLAAATTSLPEQLGGERNWDYRFCWLRDATFTLFALINAGYREEAQAWREWLLRAVAGRPDQIQIMYGIAGERWLPELTLDWLPGYEGSRPVRVGNGAYGQLQIDVYGELMDMLHTARRADLPPSRHAWQLQRTLLQHLAELWQQPDEGIWEPRGGRRNFTHSRLMAWVAFDRALKDAEQYGLEGPLPRWRALCAQIRAEILARGFNPAKNSFVQTYDGTAVDAALLLIPLVGFLDCHDPRVLGTIAAVERELLHDGLVLRYRTDHVDDGLSSGEGTFLLCSFWLADCYAKLGRRDAAVALFERLLDLRNDLGLLAEEYDPRAGRLLGNFPQAFSHVGLINTAHHLLTGHGPAEQRPQG